VCPPRFFSSVSHTRRSSLARLCAEAVAAIGHVGASTRVPLIAARCLADIVSLLRQCGSGAAASAPAIAGACLGAARPVLLRADLPAALRRAAVATFACVLVREDQPAALPPAAKACAVWTVARFADDVEAAAPDVLRLLAKTYPDEPAEVKVQVLSLAARLARRTAAVPGAGPRVRAIATYLFDAAAGDTDYAVRDRARFWRAAGAGVVGAEEARLFSSAAMRESLPAGADFLVTSLSGLLGHRVVGY